MILDQFQSRAVDECRREIGRGKRHIVLYGPCGAGKSHVITHMAMNCASKGKKSVVYTERRKLRDQISKHLGRSGVQHGVVAAGHHYDHDHKSHVAMVQTVSSRMESENFRFPDADLCLVDEHHRFNTEARQEVLKKYQLKIGFTATPVGIPDADAMVKIATHKELIASGRLVPIEVIGADEVDMEGVKRAKREYNMIQFGERVRQSAVFGNVFHWWEKCNPWHLPTIVFAPLVRESQWIVEQFNDKGIPAAHMDGEMGDDEREEILEGHKNGKYIVLSAAQLLNEGVDLPYVHYGVLLRPCGAWETFIQTANRGGRACEGKSKFTLIDHVGATARHGHPQADVDLFLGDTSASVEDRRIEALRKPKEGEQREDREPIRCPKCGVMRTPWLIHEHKYDECWACGHKHVKTTRSIIMVDGTLKKIHGERIKPKREKTHNDFWTSMIFRAVNTNMTLNQMKKVFMNERGVWPDPSIIDPRNLPNKEADGYRKASEIFPWALRKKPL